MCYIIVKYNYIYPSFLQSEEQARMARIYRRQEAAKDFDKKVRPYLDALVQATEGEDQST